MRSPPDGNKKELISKAKATLQKVQSFLTQGMSLETVLQNVNVNLNVEDAFTNACNIDILSLWGRNMDLQPVVDDIGAVMCVCSYMT